MISTGGDLSAETVFRAVSRDMSVCKTFANTYRQIPTDEQISSYVAKMTMEVRLPHDLVRQPW